METTAASTDERVNQITMADIPATILPTTDTPVIPHSNPWTISQDEQLSMMLEPLQQLRRVQECEIQLPESMQDDPGLTDQVHPCIRGIKNEETSLESELPEDWKEHLFLDWEAKDRREKYTTQIFVTIFRIQTYW